MRKLHLIMTTYYSQITCRDMNLKLTLGIHFDEQVSK